MVLIEIQFSVLISNSSRLTGVIDIYKGMFFD